MLQIIKNWFTPSVVSRDPFFLSRGAHSTPAQGRCALEYLSWLQDGSHTDRPKGVAELLCHCVSRMNDTLNDIDRQRLKPYLARCLNTADDGNFHNRLVVMRATAVVLGSFPIMCFKVPVEMANSTAHILGERTHQELGLDAGFDLLDQLLPPLEKVDLTCLEHPEALHVFTPRELVEV